MQIKKQSRYSKIKENLDSDIFNSNWIIIDTQEEEHLGKKLNFVDSSVVKHNF